MAVTPTSFRTNLPEFANTTTYPDAVINFWLGLAALLVDPARWGDLLDYGVQLFVAHNLCLEFNAIAAGAAGQNPGTVVGTLTSATVDKVGYSRDASAAMDPKDGHWNLTSYGLRYIRLVRMVGAGPIQVGTGCGPGGVGAWPGVIYPGAWG